MEVLSIITALALAILGVYALYSAKESKVASEMGATMVTVLSGAQVGVVSWATNQEIQAMRKTAKRVASLQEDGGLSTKDAQKAIEDISTNYANNLFADLGTGEETIKPKKDK